MEKQYIITVEEKDNSLIVNRENKGFMPLELIGLLQTELVRTVNSINEKSKPVERELEYLGNCGVDKMLNHWDCEHWRNQDLGCRNCDKKFKPKQEKQ